MTNTFRSKVESLAEHVISSSDEDLLKNIEHFIESIDSLLSSKTLSFEETQVLKEVHDRVTSHVETKKSILRGSIGQITKKGKGLKAYLRDAQNKSTSRKG